MVKANNATSQWKTKTKWNTLLWQGQLVVLVTCIVAASMAPAHGKQPPPGRPDCRHPVVGDCGHLIGSTAPPMMTKMTMMEPSPCCLRLRGGRKRPIRPWDEAYARGAGGISAVPPLPPPASVPISSKSKEKGGNNRIPEGMVLLDGSADGGGSRHVPREEALTQLASRQRCNALDPSRVEGGDSGMENYGIGHPCSLPRHASFDNSIRFSEL